MGELLEVDLYSILLEEKQRKKKRNLISLSGVSGNESKINILL